MRPSAWASMTSLTVASWARKPSRRCTSVISLGGVQQVDDPVAGAVAAADDRPRACPRTRSWSRRGSARRGPPRPSCRSRAASWARRRRGRRPRPRVRERRSPRSVCRTTRSSSQEIALGRGLQVHGHVELLERLLAMQLDEVLGEDLAGGRARRRSTSPDRASCSWPPSSGSESMMRELASRMPAQKAADRPTGPAPITVMSRISSKSGSRHGVQRIAGRARGSPSSAFSARSTEVAMQVKVGVSRMV